MSELEEVRKVLAELGADSSDSLADQIRSLVGLHKCHDCGSRRLEEQKVERETAVFLHDTFIYTAIVTKCLDCGAGYFDSRAETAEMEAHIKHLRQMLRAEGF